MRNDPLYRALLSSARPVGGRGPAAPFSTPASRGSRGRGPPDSCRGGSQRRRFFRWSFIQPPSPLWAARQGCGRSRLRRRFFNIRIVVRVPGPQKQTSAASAAFLGIICQWSAYQTRRLSSVSAASAFRTFSDDEVCGDCGVPRRSGRAPPCCPQFLRPQPSSPRRTAVSALLMGASGMSPQ